MFVANQEALGKKTLRDAEFIGGIMAGKSIDYVRTEVPKIDYNKTKD